MTTIQTPEVLAYIKALKPKKTEDPASMCYLLSRKVTQSTSIRLGNELEKIINLFTSSEDMRPKKAKKGKRQKDFFRRIDCVLIYGELKSNINLDTEKREATIQKVLAVGNDHVAAYPGTQCKSYVVSLRYLKTSDIPSNFVTSYNRVRLIGIGDFMATVVNTPVVEFESYPGYQAFLMSIVDALEPPQ